MGKINVRQCRKGDMGDMDGKRAEEKRAETVNIDREKRGQKEEVTKLRGRKHNSVKGRQS